MHQDRPDLNLPVIFDVIGRTGSVTLAAERLSLRQPAVSHALTRFRYAMDDPLFVRGAKGLEPTRRAQEMPPVVRKIP
ncbi:MAG: LysR family transcriptional activator of mexEF-oprN operon [Paracoccaceae bacterium]|jgi:LysR family transcriptional activator of mexEF-oprN operon